MNSSGRQIDALKLFYPPVQNKVVTEVKRVLEYYKGNPEPVNLVVASGPYTLDDSLKFEPLEDLVTALEKETPEVLILLGPFIDSKHQLILDGEVDCMPDALFQREITTRLNRLVKARPGIKIVMVPSTRDLCLEWVCFPQPPLGTALSAEKSRLIRQRLGLTPDHFVLLPNPAQFRINEIVFAVSSMDILFQLGTEEISRPSTNDTIKLDRLSKLTKHVLEQRHFFPVFPAKGHYLDFERQEMLDLQARPDILIFPSAFKHMAKNVEGVLCLNPGNLTKGKNGGTFMRVCVRPLEFGEMESIEQEDVTEHHVCERTRVDIVRV